MPGSYSVIQKFHFFEKVCQSLKSGIIYEAVGNPGHNRNPRNISKLVSKYKE